MADPNQTQTDTTQKYFDPVGAARKGPLDVSQFDDKTLFQHLNDPNKFRQAIPNYSHLSDDEITSGMQRTALRRPDLVAPPSGTTGDPKQSIKPEGTFGQRLREAGNPGVSEGSGLTEGLAEWEKQGPAKVATGAYKIAKSLVTPGDTTDDALKGLHEATSGVAATATPALPFLAAGSPLAFLRTGLLGSAGAEAGSGLTKAAGGSQAAQDVAGDIGATVAGGLASRGGSSFAKEGLSRTQAREPFDPATALTSALTKNTKVDVYGNAKVAVPSMQAAFDSLGHDVNNLPQGMQGLELHSQVTKHAIDTHEANFDKVLDSVRHEPIDPRHLQTYAPDLYAHIQEKRGGAVGPISLDDINTARLEANTAPGVGQNYLRPGTLQPNAPQTVKDWRAIGDQARKTLYPAIQAGTGVDVGQIKANEAGLLHLKDTLDLTKNLTAKAEADVQTNTAAKIREPFSGPTSKKDVAKRVMGAVVDKIRPADSPADIFNKKMALVYGAPRQSNPLTPPTVTPVRTSPNAGGLNRLPAANPGQSSDALSSIPQPKQATALERVQTKFNPADELAKVGQKPVPESQALYGASSRVPTPIRDAMTSLPTTQPTGQELTEPPFSYPPSPGSELGDLSDREITSGGRAASNRFYTSNPSSLGRIPVQIEKATKAAAAPKAEVESPKLDTESAKKLAEYEKLRKVLAALTKGEK